MRRWSLLVLALAATSVPFAGGFTAPALAECTDDYCDPPPHGMPQPLWYETGCGTITVHALKYSHTVDTRLCPGPMP